MLFAEKRDNNKKELSRIVKEKHLLWLELNDQYKKLSPDDRKPIKPNLDKLLQDYLDALRKRTEAK